MSKSLRSNLDEALEKQKKSIQTLERFVDVVRKMPGMYIGPLGIRGILNMIREIFQNSGDQLGQADSPCSEIIVSFDEKTCTTIIEDNGLGIPFGMIVKIFSTPNTSSNYTKEPFQFTSGRHGVGSKVTNMLSKSFRVISCIKGVAHTAYWEEGILVEDEHDCKAPFEQGTRVIFSSSEYMYSEDRDMGKYEPLTTDMVLAYIQSLVPQLKIGAIVRFNAIRIDGTEVHETFVNEDGIFTHLYAMCTDPIIKPIYIADNTDGYHKCEIAFTYSLENSDERIISFANTCPVQNKSTHVQGFIDGIVKFFRKYMNDIFLASNKKNKIQIIANDIREGLVCAMSVYHLNPIFEGQSKDSLENADMKPYMSNVVVKSLQEWAKNNPADINKLCTYFKDIAELRLKQDEKKANLSKNYKSNGITKLPDNYCKPSGKTGLEFWIVEGLSALGSAKLARDTLTQGVFPIRGKLPNAFTTKLEDLINNAEVSAIITIMGGGYGRNFDIDKVKFDKIVFDADADDDGAHIRNLCLMLYAVLFPELIMAGRVYKSVPPLYGLKYGKDKYKYFTTKLDYIEYIQKQFSKNHTISNLNGKALTQSQVTELLYNNAEYVRQVNIVRDIYALNPNLIELILSLRNDNFKTIKKTIESTYRFMNVSMNNSTIIMEGSIGQTQYIPINERFLKDCQKVIDMQSAEANNIYYLLNGEKKTIYDIMSIFKSSEPEINRYKGLGEMNPDQLAESTMDPNGQRTLVRYKMEDLKDIDKLRYIQSNKNLLLERAGLGRTGILV